MSQTSLLASVLLRSGLESYRFVKLMDATRDIEDALQASAAIGFGANLIVTRNTVDYKKLPIIAITPAKFAEDYMAGGEDNDA